MDRMRRRSIGTGLRHIALILFAVMAAVSALAHAETTRADSPPVYRTETVAVVRPPAAEAIVPFQTDPHPPTSASVACRSCHGESDAEIVFPSGETRSARVDLAALSASAHGPANGVSLDCDACHAGTNYRFPHAPMEDFDFRAFALSQSQACVRCHSPHLTAHPGPEWSGGFDPAASESGMSVVCTDCHGSHQVQTMSAWQLPASTSVCADCHTNVGVDLVDPIRLSLHVEAGLFAQREVNTDFCIGCHSPPGQTMTFPNGDTVSISVHPDDLNASVHGADNNWQELACNDCHQDYDLPHSPLQAESARAYTIQQSELCARCHETQHDGQMDSSHARALAEGNLDAATCVDCHGAHTTPVPNEPRSRISETCRQCHSAIFDEYAESVHGAALLADDNPDVPTCIECHGVHSIGDPTAAMFRNRSPELCASCHGNAELMEPYGISTDVFDTYVDDFHGTTVTIFQSNDPDVPTGKAVCFDCHGVHNIRRASDPDSGIKENLLVTCQQCHPGATTNFSDSWTGHHRPSLRNNPLMLLVSIFYATVIPGTVVFLLFLVGTDVYRQARGR